MLDIYNGNDTVGRKSPTEVHLYYPHNNKLYHISMFRIDTINLDTIMEVANVHFRLFNEQHDYGKDLGEYGG
jgi:hypothetical protein